MSIILDALRRGRGKPAPGPNPNAAQTDAVLQTLGYGRLNPATPLNRLKRGVGYLILAAVAAVALWALVIWLTHAYMYSPTATDAAVAPSAGKPAPIQAQAPNPPAPSAVTPQSSGAAPTDPAVHETTVVARPPAPAPGHAAQPPLPSASVARSAPAPRVPEPAADASNRFLVQNSQRVIVPGSLPVMPAGAPSRPSTSNAAGGNGPTVTTGDDHFARAMMYQRLGDFENALVSYRQVLQRDDLNVEAHNNLGVLYRDKGLLEDASRHFQRAIAINPGYARARNNLGVVYLAQRKPDMSASQFHAALAIDPRNVESMVNLSTLEKESGQHDEARRWLTRALAIDPRNPEAHYNMGLIDDEAGNQTQAQAHYRAFLQYGAASHPSLVGDVRKRLELLAGK